jgi:hypothetical protein
MDLAFLSTFLFLLCEKKTKQKLVKMSGGADVVRVEAAEILFLKEKRIATKSRTMANIILNYF